MPMITMFYVIIIKMFFSMRKHNPPHIHAIYGEYEGILDLRSMNMIEGDLPARALKLVQEWMALHQSELLAMWNNKQIKKLPPLV